VIEIVGVPLSAYCHEVSLGSMKEHPAFVKTFNSGLQPAQSLKCRHVIKFLDHIAWRLLSLVMDGERTPRFRLVHE
jgi:hypothetical protein